ncbi:MAG: hypothetical protein ACF8NJ_01525 [Phycisphaerales bacterium JB038]
MKHAYRMALPVIAAGQCLAGATLAQTQQEVNIMLSILVDASDNSTEYTDCGDPAYAEFYDLRDGLAEMLADPDVIPRDGSVALGVYFYGGEEDSGGETAFCDYVEQAMGDPQQEHGIVLVTEDSIDDIVTNIEAQEGINGNAWLYSAMRCVGERMLSAETDDFDAVRRIVLIIPHGSHDPNDGEPANARDYLLAGATPIAHEVDALACASGFLDSWPTALSYLGQQVIGGDGDPLQVPYPIEDYPLALDAGCFGAVPETACSDSDALSHYREQLKVITRVALWRCPYDYVGINHEGIWNGLPDDEYGDGMQAQPELGVLLAGYEPNYDVRADLDHDGDVDQTDLGMLLADYGCGSHWGY